MEIDLTWKETEAGWQAILDNFWLQATSVWFDWLKWIMMVAALIVVADKSGNLVFKSLKLFSLFSMFFYFAAFFSRIRVKGLPVVRSQRGAFAFSLALGGLLTTAAAWCAISLASAVATMSK